MLFICGRNKLRSPTAERVFTSYPGIEVASAGLDEDSDVRVDPELLEWADIIFVMEKRQRARLSRRFGGHLRTQRIISLDIPDQYQFMDDELVRILSARVAPHLAKID